MMEGLSPMEALAWACHEAKPKPSEALALMQEVSGRDDITAQAMNVYVFRARNKVAIK